MTQATGTETTATRATRAQVMSFPARHFHVLNALMVIIA